VVGVHRNAVALLDDDGAAPPALDADAAAEWGRVTAAMRDLLTHRERRLACAGRSVT
jgi:hypothetical protein